ncbi:MAG: nucleotidyltransferase domain-containing protein [Thiohalomonadaceae bacterium]
MRLTERQIHIIKEEVAQVFGPYASVWLFGSRTDDTAKGGDIDIMVEAAMSPDDALEKELKLYARLIRRLGDRRIDIIVHRADAPMLAVHQAAVTTGVRL